MASSLPHPEESESEERRKAMIRFCIYCWKKFEGRGYVCFSCWAKKKWIDESNKKQKAKAKVKK